MAIPGVVAEKFFYPLANVLSQMERLVMPRGFGLAAPGDITTGVYGSAVPARRSYKPFIVGLIPPDVPVDFLPFKKVQSSIMDIQPDAFPPGASDSPSPGAAKASTVIRTGNRGLEPQVSQRTKTGEIRQAVYETYFKQTGVYPSEQTVNLITAQMMLERGGNVSNIESKNFNFGNTHASGARAPVGQVPTPPSGGSYYLGVDYDGNGQPYATYFNSFPSAQAGVEYQVNRLLNKWNAAANATTALEYGEGLLPGPPNNYHETPPAVYARGLQLHVNRIEASVANGGAGGHIGGAPQVDSPSYAVDGISTNQQDARVSVMTSGSTQLESDAAGDRIGKLVEFDASRLEIARLQTDALRRQIEAVRAVPGLLMMVNPSEFSLSFEPTVDNTVKGRNGNIVHVWLEKPAEMSCSGVTSGQYVVDSSGNGGLTGELRTFSASYQNLLSLLSIYKTNGIIFSGPEAPSNVGVAEIGYSVFIYFDNVVYVGSFTSFEITDSDMKPHNMAYSYRFNVRYYFEVGNDGRFTDFEVGVNQDQFRPGSGR